MPLSTLESLGKNLKEAHGPRGDLLDGFARALYARAPAPYMALWTDGELSSALVDMLEWIETRDTTSFSVRVVRTPWLEAVGPTRRAIEVVGPDQPFLVDSLRELMRVHGLPVVALLHPVLEVERDEASRLTRLETSSSTAGRRESRETLSFMHAETDGILTDEEARKIEAEAQRVFLAAREVVNDFRPMRARVHDNISKLRSRRELTDEKEACEELEEVAALLEWLLDSNFVFLGVREYRIDGEGSDRKIRIVEDSGLGALRDTSDSIVRTPKRFEELPPDLRRRLEDPSVLGFHKTRAESLVLRRTRMDYIIVRDIDEEGVLRSEVGFAGLLTPRALGELPAKIPVLRKKLELILDKAGVSEGSHDHKEYFSTFCSLPKAQLFLHNVDVLGEIVHEVSSTRDQEEIRLHYHYDVWELVLSVMVLLPRERFNSDVRRAIRDLLMKAFDAQLIEYQLAITDEPLARLHFALAPNSADAQHPKIAELEGEIAKLARSWDEELRYALDQRYEAGKASWFHSRFAKGFPAAYIAQESPRTACLDVALIEDSEHRQGPGIKVSSTRETDLGSLSLVKIVRPQHPFHLSRLMPILSHLGLTVFDETTYEINSSKALSFHLHRFRTAGPGGENIPEKATASVEETVLAVLAGRAPDDLLNTLVTLTGFAWRQIDVLRTYVSYLLQIERGGVRQASAFHALWSNPHPAITLIELFEARFDPTQVETERVILVDSLRDRLAEELSEVAGIQEDRVLRTLENLILATVRTNYFQRGPNGPRPTLTLKIASSKVHKLPLPRPHFELFVAGRELEGVHLRSGKVARGGIRFSDRADDYRTEILGLMKAQRTKNALIVPMGAKGGFVAKTPLDPDDPRADLERRYELFIGSLLELSDNVVEGAIVHPPDTVIHDGEDPYLVVAADKGTAHFSDTANELASEHSFWLGDAFASGGRTGYNHKDVGITARGAWEGVRRHFLAEGIDIQKDEFSVVGIGDMSGDVFGNGMLLSETIRLVAAFDHRHIFIDPHPDAASSYRERRRLFELERSSWDDYDRSLLSAGGGIFPRDSKSVSLSPEIRALLETEAECLNGPELMRALLTLPVDLLWNGGIGTYVRASEETDLEVGDPANDALRVTAAELRTRVVGEGGNLGLTPAARVEFARRGGRVNADFVDNSGGVNLSDREVNLKILLDAVDPERLEPAERDRRLREVEEEITARVLADNREQSDALSLESRRHRIVHLRWLVDRLERDGLLHRDLEALPSDAEFEELHLSEMGLTRPQLAVVLAYAKGVAKSRIARSLVSDGGAFVPSLLTYFPASFVKDFRREIAEHPLRREITVTQGVNACLNRMGPTFLERLANEEQAPLERVLEAWLEASLLAELPAQFAAVERALETGAASAEECETLLVEFTDRVERVTRWYLRRGVLADEFELDSVPLVKEEANDERAVWLDPASRNRHARVGRLVEELEVFSLARELGVPREEARAAFEFAKERLFAEALAREAKRLVLNSMSEWQMMSALDARLARLLRRLALRIHGREGAQGSAPEVLSDLDPDRREAERMLLASQGGHPLNSSGLFVLINSLERAMESVGDIDRDP